MPPTSDPSTLGRQVDGDAILNRARKLYRTAGQVDVTETAAGIERMVRVDRRNKADQRIAYRSVHGDEYREVIIAGNVVYERRAEQKKFSRLARVQRATYLKDLAEAPLSDTLCWLPRSATVYEVTGPNHLRWIGRPSSSDGPREVDVRFDDQGRLTTVTFSYGPYDDYMLSVGYAFSGELSAPSPDSVVG